MAACWYRVSETDPISKEEPDAAHVERPHHGYELVGFNKETTSLHSQQPMWIKCLFEEERLMVDQPVAERACP